MAIKIRESADPLSEKSRKAGNQNLICCASSAAGRVFQQELEKYCSGEIAGRSFLIAGHRGAGKTTMVTSSIDEVLRKVRYAKAQGSLLPLPVFLHGPSLFAEEPVDSPGGGAATLSKEPSAATVQADQAKVALVQIILGLHRASVQEFVNAYRERLLERMEAEKAKITGSGKRFDLARQHISFLRELLGLAAQFEIEILENPPAYRLHEFWEIPGLLHSGILWSNSPVPDQGYRELVALNGICNAHQRISGDLSAKEQQEKGIKIDDVQTSEQNLKFDELIKPLMAVASGVLVTAGGAAGSGELVKSSIFGLVTAALASSFLKTSRITTGKRNRQLDSTFIPDLSHKTLDRVLPMLLQRLRNAGLAPILIIDELDKVQGLSTRLDGMVHFLKKLVAENVFTCFLTDRGYLEHLRVIGKNIAYGKAYSYFSHPLLVAFQPQELDGYLERLLVVSPSASQGDAPLPSQGAQDELDKQVLKWVLRHRSQLHALALSREIAFLQRGDGQLGIPQGFVRTQYTYRIDLTFQVAAELQLREASIVGWQRQRLDMLQALNDSLYYLSRKWMDGHEVIVLNAEEKKKFIEYICKRMNLEEIRNKPVAASPDVGSDSETGDLLLPDDQDLLFSIVERMVRFLSDATTKIFAEKAWEDACNSQGQGNHYSKLEQSVLDAMLMQEDSLLCSVPTGSTTNFRWRYLPSGIKRSSGESLQTPAFPVDEGIKAVSRILQVKSVWERLLFDVEHQDTISGEPFPLLAETLRVLPTSPAWTAVSKAIGHLELAKDGKGNRNSLPEDCQTVIAFDKMLQENEGLLNQVLLCAAFFGGLSKGATHGEKLRHGLGNLSVGLQFYKLNADGIKTSLTAVENQIFHELMKFKDTSNSKNSSVWEVRSIDGGTVDDFLKILASLVDRKREIFFEHRSAAWDSLYLRINSIYRSKTIKQASFSELICAAMQIGPSRFVGLDPSGLSVGQWSSTLLHCLVPEGENNSMPELAPRWLVHLSLVMLGLANLSSPTRQSLFEYINSLPDNRFFMTNDGGVDIGIPKIHNNPLDKIAVIITNSESPMAEQWKDVPRSGLAFVFNEITWRQYVNYLFSQSKNPLLSRTTLLAIEHPTLLTDKDRQDIDRLKNFSSLSVLNVYGSSLENQEKPCINSPQSVDDIMMAVGF